MGSRTDAPTLPLFIGGGRTEECKHLMTLNLTDCVRRDPLRGGAVRRTPPPSVKGGGDSDRTEDGSF